MAESDDLKNACKIDVAIRFYEELNDFLKGYPLKRDLEISFYGKRSVKDLIESFGVPHVEVDLILVNGEPAGFGHFLENGDRISVYPVFERLSISGISKLRERPLRDARFVLDVHLGKLARYLRLLGFDAEYGNGWDDAEILGISNSRNSIILTRDRQLLKRSAVERGMHIRNSDPFRQTVEVLRRLDLWDEMEPFTRCMACNGIIAEVMDEKEYSCFFEGLPPRVKIWCREIYRCSGCGKIYWKGSHYDRMTEFVQRILEEKDQ